MVLKKYYKNGFKDIEIIYINMNNYLDKLPQVVFDKITLRISKLVQPNEADIIDPTVVAMKVITSIYSGITTEELDLESAKICSNMVTINPIYGNLAGRILVSNLHKKTLNSFVEKMEAIQANTNLLDKEWFDWIIVNREAINNMMDYERDYIFDFFGFSDFLIFFDILFAFFDFF